MKRHEFPRIMPGDIGFDEGIGISGWLIRTATRSAYGHCWVYHTLLEDDGHGNQVWRTVEAGPRRGLIWRTRKVSANKVVRVWRDQWEQQAVVRASEKMVGYKYGWGEICRIILRLVGIRVRRWRDNPWAVICSNHVAQCAVAARPEFGFYLRFEPNEVWPGELALMFDAFIWDTELA